MYRELGLRKVVGCGKTRSVWLVHNEPDVVIKVAHRFNEGAGNKMEWAIWNSAPEDFKKFLVPALEIYYGGLCLKMVRGFKIAKNEIPTNIPPGVTDTKASNWVRIGDKILLADYAQGGVLKYLNITKDQYEHF